MTIFNDNPPNDSKNNWQHQLNKFVRTNQKELAALAWGLHLEKGETDETIGIDLKETPKFVYCSKAAIERLNRNVDGKIQEILGLIDGYKPELEVLMIAIGDGQIKLVYFQPEISPPDCFEQLGQDVDTLLKLLETEMSEYINTNLIK
ncbi:MAG: hypothetical protein F6K25_02820 [Okeania sp. SIO2G4]|uniref:beta-carboxysome assembly chaperone CcmS n=1 Tax=unclassified Okeania TaxID=2634635 RepID=UPI0013B67F34|nr:MULTISPECIES: hypothetical protein [unclassified Okeania]NEP04722.1 hypothetical protein [Okeania sp. SIO4D6]NEP38036.1 hypothetical protein [Okeania sp. SIO2H7]NEP71428.1 hypothetical protein [Okeania sp. SIO2G5]NEP96080.1 hypothetical protein [Okeania sp. SIO2F5]NEQ89731.1 hypothetical protein [Okeania sp. SIO2G4]